MWTQQVPTTAFFVTPNTSGTLRMSSMDSCGLGGGHFLQIDVPGAAQTAGGGINDFGVVVGHYN